MAAFPDSVERDWERKPAEIGNINIIGKLQRLFGESMLYTRDGEDASGAH